MILYADLETFSETSIKVGSHRYAEDSEILLFGYAIDDEPAKVWDLTCEPMPYDLKLALDVVQAGEAKTCWHNGMMFDTIVLEHHGIHIPLNMIIDTMVIAYEHGLPGKLGDLCDVMRMPKDVAKDKDGRRLVQLFCKPLGKNRKLRRATRATHPEDWKKFVNYCRLDVEAERALYKKMPKFNCTPWEHKLQVLDAEINRRGMLMDLELAKGAVRLSERDKRMLADEVCEKTDGEVQSATQRDALKDYIKEHFDWELKDMTKAELEKRVDDPRVPEPVRDLLKLRLMSTKTSITKFKAVLNSVSSDGRLRGCLQFRGAARTGRWSGRLFQPQNIARPTIKQHVIEWATDCVKDDTFEMWFDKPSEILPNLLRGEIVAPEGKKLVVADYSNVEGRVLAWQAGESWKLQAFRDFDAGHGHDLYKVAYGKAFNIDPGDVTHDQRRVGKVIELGLGFGGGVAAFLIFSKGYGIDLKEMAKAVMAEIDPQIWAEAEESYDFFVEKKLTCGLDRNTFLACDSVKRAWRKSNPKIVQYWHDMDEAIETAMTGPDIGVAGPVKIKRCGNYLVVRLPSGRFLSYPSPRLGSIGSKDDRFSYMGVDQYTRKWTRIRSYAAKVVENVTQAIACDLLSNGLFVLDEHGYKTVLTVHDEAITEAPDTDEYNYKDMEKLMSTLPDWAEGLPLVAAGYEAYRYRKD